MEGESSSGKDVERDPERPNVARFRALELMRSDRLRWKIEQTILICFRVGLLLVNDFYWATPIEIAKGASEGTIWNALM